MHYIEACQSTTPPPIEIIVFSYLLESVGSEDDELTNLDRTEFSSLRNSYQPKC